MWDFIERQWHNFVRGRLPGVVVKPFEIVSDDGGVHTRIRDDASCLCDNRERSSLGESKD